MCRSPAQLELSSIAPEDEPLDALPADDEELELLLAVTWAWQPAAGALS